LPRTPGGLTIRTKFEFDFHTDATPEQVVELLTDFSPNRLNSWPALSAKAFHVYMVGDRTADAREGQDFPKIWSTWHYDWSTPGKVVLTVTESDAIAPGSHVSFEAKPNSNRGSDVHAVWDQTAKNTTGRVAVYMMRFIGRSLLTRYYTRVYDQFAASG
jgi:hypothetical protein